MVFPSTLAIVAVALVDVTLDPTRTSVSKAVVAVSSTVAFTTTVFLKRSEVIPLV